MRLISLKYSLQAPASEIQDKISFIINNLSPANAETKAREFSEFFQEQYYPWFAQYLVMKRYNYLKSLISVFLFVKLTVWNAAASLSFFTPNA